MFKRGLIAVAIAIGVLAASAVPAQAIPVGDNLVVIAYYSNASKTVLVGQQWSGCGQPSGSWGITTNFRNLFFTPC